MNTRSLAGGLFGIILATAVPSQAIGEEVRRVSGDVASLASFVRENHEPITNFSCGHPQYGFFGIVYKMSIRVGDKRYRIMYCDVDGNGTPNINDLIEIDSEGNDRIFHATDVGLNGYLPNKDSHKMDYSHPDGLTTGDFTYEQIILIQKPGIGDPLYTSTIDKAEGLYRRTVADILEAMRNLRKDGGK